MRNKKKYNVIILFSMEVHVRFYKHTSNYETDVQYNLCV